MDTIMGLLKRMRYAYLLAIGIVLTVIGANLPNVIVCGIGIAVLVISGIAFLLTHTSMTEDTGNEREEYVRDLKDTVDGYGMSVSKHEREIEASADEFMAPKPDEQNRRLGRQS